MGITQGIELDISPDDTVPGKIWTFAQARRKRALRVYMMCARTGYPRLSPEVQEVIRTESFTKEQLDILLAKSRATRAATLKVGEECKLKSDGVELEDESPEERERGKMSILEGKILDTYKNFNAMPGELKPSPEELNEFVELCQGHKAIFQESFVTGNEPAKLGKLRVKLKKGAKPRTLRLRGYSPAHKEFMRKALMQLQRKYEKIRLVNAGWSPIHQQAFDDCKDALVNAITQGHYDPTCTLCLFTDASDTHWAGLLTQVRDWKEGIPIEQ